MNLEVATTAPVPYHREPWTEIVTGLYIGGHYYLGGAGIRRAIVKDEFDLVISLHQPSWTEPERFGPAAGVRHEVYLIPDGELTKGQLEMLFVFSGMVAQTAHDGRKVLVRCQAGYNRSALVAGITLIMAEMDAGAAIGRIRAARGSHALHEPLFVDYLYQLERDLS